MKPKRHAEILDIIADQAVATQEELLKLLREHGFEVTQATVSRDIRQLRLVKLTDSNGITRYMVQADSGAQSRRTILTESVIDIVTAGNLVIIKCHTGTANAVAVAVDYLKPRYLLGCVAGDDTIFAAATNPEFAGLLADELQDMLF